MATKRIDFGRFFDEAEDALTCPSDFVLRNSLERFVSPTRDLVKPFPKTQKEYLMTRLCVGQCPANDLKAFVLMSFKICLLDLLLQNWVLRKLTSAQ